MLLDRELKYFTVIQREGILTLKEASEQTALVIQVSAIRTS